MALQGNQDDRLDRLERRLERVLELLEAQRDEYLDVEAVQRLTGLSRSAIYQKASRKGTTAPELASYKRGKRLYFKRSEVERWMAGDRVAGEAEVRVIAAQTYSSYLP